MWLRPCRPSAAPVLVEKVVLRETVLRVLRNNKKKGRALRRYSRLLPSDAWMREEAITVAKFSSSYQSCTKKKISTPLGIQRFGGKNDSEMYGERRVIGMSVGLESCMIWEFRVVVVFHQQEVLLC